MKYLSVFTLILFLASPVYSAEDLTHITGAGGTVYFDCDFENGYQYLTSSNPHSGGGYFYWLGGSPLYPEGTGCSDVYNYHNTIISNESAAQGAVSGSMYSLKTPYRGICPNESFTRDTTIIRLGSDRDDIYVRWYQKWTGDWNSSTVQHKFTKFCSTGYESDGDKITAHFSFANGARNWRNYTTNLEGRFDMDGIPHANWVWIYQTREGAGSQYHGVTRAWDDINNGINDGNDGELYFQPNKWYCIEIHAKVNSSASIADAVCEAWVDGVKVFEIKNFKYYNDPAKKYGTGYIELQHIYYDRTPTDQPTYMDNIVIADSYIGPMRDEDPSDPSGATIRASGTANWR